jgi:Rrf2 family iron-sulfur cluster assembly transcriptional regulator
MKLTTKGKFAVTALLDMALNSSKTPKSPITLYNISERQGISLSYLEQLFVKLRRSGLVISHKGPGGGYVLAKALDEVSIAEIIKIVDDDMDARSCHGMMNCKDNQRCLTHDLWDGLTKHVYAYLEGVTLKDLIVNPGKPINKTQLIFAIN